MHFVGILSMVIYVVSLYTWYLRYNICSAWFLDIRISTCLHIYGFEGNLSQYKLTRWWTIIRIAVNSSNFKKSANIAKDDLQYLVTPTS